MSLLHELSQLSYLAKTEEEEKKLFSSQKSKLNTKCHVVWINHYQIRSNVGYVVHPVPGPISIKLLDRRVLAEE
jgi:hypothetical protein